ncbi:MAG: hypothetical protein E6K39_19085 [Gammaproteobacteria bacterium]|nr:MAG: hypothetical protein E6K39_19085 [Gammaproteobacteria bacterium]
MSARDETGPGAMRIDRWLFGVRLFKSRSSAVDAVRGPASEAARCYDETPASKARREVFAARMKVAAGLTPRPDDRPDKHDRRLLRRLRGRN